MRARAVVAAFIALGVAFALAVGGCHRRPKPSTIAEDLAVIAQSLDAPLEDPGMGWLPASAKAVGTQQADIGPNGGTLVVSAHGGPYYRLVREHADAGGASTTWSLTIDRLNAPAEVTYVTIPKDRKLPMPVLGDRILAEYARRIDAHPSDLDDHLFRFAFALHYRGHPAARALLVDSIGRAPKLAQVRMALALLDDVDGRTDGMRDLDAWAHAKPTFTRLSDLALTHWLLDHADPAIAALREAIKQPLTIDGREPLTPIARALPIADLALAERRFDAAIEIATFMLDARDLDTTARKYAALDWRALRAAATYRKGDKAAASAQVSDGLVDPQSPTSPSDTRPKLAAAIRAHDDAAVDAWSRPNLGSDPTTFLFPAIDLPKTLGLVPPGRGK